MSTYTIEPVTRYRVGGHGRSRDCSSREQAELQRAEWEGIDAANKVLDSGGTLGEAVAKMGRTCPPEVAHLTIEHGIRISYWQCTDYYAYHLRYFNERGELEVGGVGGWSGYYGNTVSLVDLARYPNRLGVESDPRAEEMRRHAR